MKKQTLVLLAVAAAAVGGLVWWRKQTPSDSTTTTKASSPDDDLTAFAAANPNSILSLLQSLYPSSPAAPAPASTTPAPAPSNVTAAMNPVPYLAKKQFRQYLVELKTNPQALPPGRLSPAQAAKVQRLRAKLMAKAGVTRIGPAPSQPGEPTPRNEPTQAELDAEQKRLLRTDAGTKTATTLTDRMKPTVSYTYSGATTKLPLYNPRAGHTRTGQPNVRGGTYLKG